MRTLEWLHRKLGVIGVEFVAVEREGLRPAECHTHVIDKFERRRLAEIIVESERAKIICIDSGNEPQLHAATEHLIDNRDLLGQAQGMVQRDNVTHRANAQTTRACARSDRVQTRRGHPALIGAEVMLDTKPVIKAEFIA
jgi:hypothetical protein